MLKQQEDMPTDATTDRGTDLAERGKSASAPSRPLVKNRPVLRFVRTSLLFLVGLAVAIALADRAVGRHIRRQDGMGLIGIEVYQVVRKAERRNRNLHTLVLGDSVARQLFTPATEPRKDISFLTSNQAISAAGQYYLLEAALRHDRGVKDVYLLYVPGCFGNNLPPLLSHDYFCGFFHSPRSVWELFNVKHDCELTAAHLGHCLMPNLLLANSSWHPAPAGIAPPSATTGGNMTQSAPDPEPVLSLLDWTLRRRPDPPPSPAGSYGPALPPVSKHYLKKMKELCQSKDIALHVLPCPLSRDYLFQDSEHIFDIVPLRVDPAWLMDPVHFKEPYVEQAREMTIAYYHLPFR